MAGQNEKDALETEAARWHARRTSADLTAEEELAFQDWLRAAPEHAVAYARVSRTWEVMEALRGNTEAGPRSLPYSALFDRRAAVAAAVGTIAVGAVLWGSRTEARRISTAIGEQRHLALADGSHVLLNTNSTIEVNFTPKWRSVKLVRGEALFDVAKDPKRKFRVEASGSQIVALGTAFGVRIRGGRTRLLMTEGLVQVSNGARGSAPVHVSAGKEALIGPHAIRVLAIAPDDMQRLLSWQHGILEFNSETVQQIADEFNRYSRSKIVVVDAKTASLRFGGRFGVRDGRRFVEALCSVFPIRAIYGQDGNIYLAALH